MSSILVVDDDPRIVRTLEIMLCREGHGVLTASTGEEAVAKAEAEPVDIALVDLQLPGIGGTEVLRRLRALQKGVETIIITAHGSIETAVEAMKEGAFDYLTKPFSPDQVRHRLRQIERVRQLTTRVAGLEQRLGELPFQHAFITRNPATLRMLEVARSVASSDATVLIMGESGTGKSLLARLIHESSRRASGPFVTVDCTSFQESLLESELFGHRRGAFTGALADKAGKIELAEGGTLFLDEIGEIPLHLQAKLLRLVEERAYERLGDPATRHVDARVLAATNRDLQEMVRDRAFREDLFYRLGVVDLTVPALRHRQEDIPLLARPLMERYAKAHGRQADRWDEAFERELLGYGWPGNVRELAHIMERAVLLASDRVLRPEHMPRRLREALIPERPEALQTLAELEEAHIRRALSVGLSQEETARRLGIDPSTLWRKRKRYGI